MYVFPTMKNKLKLIVCFSWPNYRCIALLSGQIPQMCPEWRIWVSAKTSHLWICLRIFLIFLGFSIIHTSFICSKYIYKSISLFLRSELIEIFCNRDQINANSTFEKEYRVTPLLANNKEKRGLALDGKLKDEDTNLASSTLSVNLLYKSIRLIFMFIVQITALYFYTLQRKTTLLFIKSQINKVTHLHLSLSLCSLQPDMDKQIQGIIVSYKIKVTLVMGGGLLGSLTLRFGS